MHLSGVGAEELAQLARALVAGDVDSADIPASLSRSMCFGLIGTLGAGKTRFCQEIAHAWAIDPAAVTSPTFTLLKSYEIASDRGQRDCAVRYLHHLDLYRVADEDELWELGLDELCELPGSWILVEWADRFAASLPADTIWIRIEVGDDPLPDQSPLSMRADASLQPPRTIEFQSSDPQQQEWLNSLQSRLRHTGFTGTIASG